MRRLVIAVDCDDVLVLSAQPIIDGYNAMFGTQLHPKDVYGAATHDNWGTDDDEVAKTRVETYLRSDQYRPVPPLPEAVDAIKVLAGVHELHLVTGRSEDREPETLSLIQTYFPGCFTTIEHTNNYASARMNVRTRTKGEVCADIHADVLIDDHIVHGNSVIDAGLKEVIVFGDYPWNRDEPLVPGMQRCQNWSEVLREVDGIATR